MPYVLISMKHTHKNDPFITLWKGNDRGYTIFLSNTWKYDEIEDGYHNSVHTLPVEREKVSSLFELYLNGPEWEMILPNKPHVWEALGLKLTNEGLRRA